MCNMHVCMYILTVTVSLHHMGCYLQVSQLSSELGDCDVWFGFGLQSLQGCHDSAVVLTVVVLTVGSITVSCAFI